MLQSFKNISWVFLLAAGLQISSAFSLLGPVANGGDAWQVEAIAYNPIPANNGAPPFFLDVLPVGPKNIGEEYRRNTPVMYYACDANFLDFFGSSGSAAVDQAFTILDNSLTNVNAYSSALTEFPLKAEQPNFQASALNLLDVKSETMALMMEQLGLADPVRYVWALHNRFQPPLTICPDQTTYQVIMRNFDIVTSPLNQLQYSAFINGSLYTYVIDEICNSPEAPPNADAYEVPADHLTANLNSPVASLNELGLTTGSFFTGLTRDDVGGLRYLISTNNVIFESPTPGSVLLSSTQSGGTNFGAPFPLFTSDLTAFILSAQTNSPAVLTNLFPGLIVTSSSNFFTVVQTPNIVAVFTNLIGAPAGSQTLVITTNFTFTVMTNYVDTFANVVTNIFHPTSTATLVTVQVQQLNGAPAGTLTTKTTTKNITLNVPSGDFYINTNTCGPNLLLSTLFTNVVATTNLLLTASNSAGLFFSQSEVTFATNHILLVEPVVCGAVASGGSTTNAPGLYQGIGKIRFVKASFDSLLGQFFQPITNTYSEVLVANHQSVKQTFQRVVTTPDLLFTAADLLPSPAADNTANIRYSRSINFDQSNIGAGLAGPGVINPSSTITFTKVGPVFQNVGTASLDLSTATEFFVWGSFDETTNDPVVYPDGTSIANLANQVLIQITPANSLPDGTHGVAYPAITFTATGGPVSPPFVWSLASGPVVSGGLPPGMTLSSGGTISGTPTQSGTFDFTVELTDSSSHTVTWNYSITIN